MTTYLRAWMQTGVWLLILPVTGWAAPPQDVILEWNAVALEANVLDHTGPDLPGDLLSDTQGPPASARVLAIVHAAMYDAYNSIDYRSSPYLLMVPNARGASPDAAVAKAAHDTLLALIPAGADMYDLALRRTLRRVPSGVRLQRGLWVGTKVAERILQLRAGDADFLGGTYTPSGLPGEHDVDPKNPTQSFISPEVGGMPPFAVPDITVFRAPQPPSLDSDEYTFAFHEVMTLGEFRGGDTGLAAPTDDESYVVANYWSYNGSPLIGTPPRLYNQIARVIAIQRRNKVHENARMFALLNLAMGDAGISAWDTKYTYDYWRPVLGIRRADEDGNDLTLADPTWCPLGASRSNPFPGEGNFSPAFPAYTSGHATFGAAVFKSLANFYQTDNIQFTFVSDEWNGQTVDQFGRLRPLVSRTYNSLSEAAAENAASRVFNGVHWRFDGVEGMRAGNAIADYVYDNLLRPRTGPRRTSIPDADYETQIDAILTAAANQVPE
ncbi:MAG: phosphatase PAP2 family protein [Pirellulaceae bacterium]|nr:phosphatase PAP2 family protein [Pirellulaceae bacterium]